MMPDLEEFTEQSASDLERFLQTSSLLKLYGHRIRVSVNSLLQVTVACDGCDQVYRVTLGNDSRKLARTIAIVWESCEERIVKNVMTK